MRTAAKRICQVTVPLLCIDITKPSLVESRAREAKQLEQCIDDCKTHSYAPFEFLLQNSKVTQFPLADCLNSLGQLQQMFSRITPAGEFGENHTTNIVVLRDKDAYKCYCEVTTDSATNSMNLAYSVSLSVHESQ